MELTLTSLIYGYCLSNVLPKKAESLVGEAHMDTRHGPAGWISQHGCSHAWLTRPAKRLRDKNRQIPAEERTCVCVCVCVCPVSVVETDLYTSCGHLKGLGWVWLPWECLEALNTE